jgi:two-component system cell cycle sensor histidine kinase/response regulator CckA
VPIAAPVVVPPASQRGVVLLVDDEDPVRRLAERALARAGWQVLAADCGDEALALLRERQADSAPIAALVSDMVMPGMDGVALMRAVRTLCGNSFLPVVLVSGYAESPLRGGLSGDSAGAKALFLAKPYRLADLVATLDQAISETLVCS